MARKRTRRVRHTAHTKAHAHGRAHRYALPAPAKQDPWKHKAEAKGQATGGRRKA